MEQSTIRRVAVGREDNEDGYFIVALGEQADGSGGHLILTRALEFDEQDRSSGMDTYCITVSGGVTHYGGIVSWRLKNRQFVIQFDDESSELLNADGGYQLSLDVDEACLRKLEDGLRRVLVGVPRLDP